VTAPANRWKLGLFVLAGSAATLAALTVVGMSELKRSYHTAYAYFDEALTGLEEGSPVKFRGVRIGVVERIRVAKDKKHLEVRASLYDTYLEDLGLDVSMLEDEYPLPENLRAQVVMSWVTGTAFIQVDFFPDPSSGPQMLPFPTEQPTLRTVPSAAKGLEDASREVLRELPLVALSARELLDQMRSDLQSARVPELAGELRAVLSHLDEQLLAMRQHGTVAAATAAVASIGDAATSLRDERGAFASTLREIQQLVGALRTQVDAAEVAQTLGSVRSAAGSLSGLRSDVGSELPQLRATLLAVERLAAMLERDPESLLRGRGPLQRPLEGTK
jgi:ABC-type transporter Mla subunit MlaD